MLPLKNISSVFKDLPVSYLAILPNSPIFSIIDCNEAFLKLTASARPEISEKGLFDALEMISAEFIKQARQIETQLNKVILEKLSSTLNTANWSINFIPILEDNGELLCVVQTIGALPEIPKADHLVRLTREKEKYHRLFNLSPIPQWVYSRATLHFLDVNDAAVSHYGYTKEEFLSMKITQIRPQEDVKILEDILFNTLEADIQNSSTVRHQKKNGEIIDVIVEGNSIYFEDEDARLVIAVDNTEKIKEANALAASERRFKALIQEGSDLISIMDADGCYQYINPSTASILGVDLSSLLGKKGMDFVHPDDRKRVIRQSGQMEFNNRTHIDPFRFRVGENQYRWIESIMVNMTDDPAIGGIVANSRDVTRQMENEKKMEESIARFGIVSKATSDAIWDHDFVTGKVVWNKGLKGIFGHNRLTSNHHWWHALVHPDDVEEVEAKVKSSILNKIPRIKVEYRFRCADGSYKHTEDRAFLLFDHNGDPVRMIGSMQDITERVNYINAMEQQNKRLKEISWMQSHHVRAPLARIMGIAGLLTDKENNNEEETQEFLQYLTDSSTELDEIIKEIVRKTEGL